MANEALYLGKTIRFPIVINQYGRPDIVEGLDCIPQSIEMILNTPRGSRFFLPQYGSDLDLLMFLPNDEILQSLLYTNIFDALDTWEKRIKVLDITFKLDESQPEKVDCSIQYKILKSNEVKSYIYPFYTETTT